MANDTLPIHIAIIMDGNGRWAKQRNKKRTYGHYVGARVVDDIAEQCSKMGIKYLTLYTFSTENWKRPKSEVKFLLHLLRIQIRKKENLFKENNIKFNVIGDISVFDSDTQQILNNMIYKTKNNKSTTLTLALNYGSKQEIVKSFKSLSEELLNGEIGKDDISEDLIEKHLYTINIPDVDLLIRTGGEKRISNFMLWQISYAELVFFDKYWPEFTPKDLISAIDEFKKRKRRFGGL